MMKKTFINLFKIILVSTFKFDNSLSFYMLGGDMVMMINSDLQKTTAKTNCSEL
jgi:hypothetical protein